MAEQEKDVDDYTTKGRKAVHKQPKKGFSVGPANLPDGTYRRKTQKIKNSLIAKAKIKKDYAKLKKKGQVPDEPKTLPLPASLQAERRDQEVVDGHMRNPHENMTELHPDRQTLIHLAGEQPEPADRAASESQRPKRRARPTPFKRDYEDAQKRQADSVVRRQAREQAEEQRQQRLQERERFRNAMAKARTGGPNGQRKLGRESKVLLEKVKRMVSES